MSGHRSSRKRCGESRIESPMDCGHVPATVCVLRKLVQLPTPPLSKHQLKRLEEHKYQSAGQSLLEPLMQGYWEWLVGRIPAWIAPNLITITGLLINICTTVILVYYCPTAAEQAPPWAYFACACGLFIYQSLDAIDGKQARRTNSSTPLGELFDHGCDSLSTVFVVLGTCIAVQLGTNPDWMFFCCFAGTFMFYCAHWQTYVSGTLRFGIIDVTEVQIFIIIMHLLAVIGGPPFWQSMIPVLNIQMKIFPALCTVAGTIFSCTNYFGVIFTGGVGKNGSTIALKLHVFFMQHTIYETFKPKAPTTLSADTLSHISLLAQGTSVLSPFLHIGSVIILAAMIYKKSAVQLFEKHPCLYILTFGFVSAKITNKLVVAHMTKSEMHLHDTAFIGPALLFLDQYFNSFIDEYIVLWIAMIFSLFDLLRYCISVCNQIASHLRIHVFRIKVSSTHSNHH
ncbi:choline/ethanolaminephosphotransferase 1 isoform X1 [Chelonia mydas]|uniref:choline/ethanolaminephosphotransferase 1 isoform X1 n=1 Tax=Chelonia mydas TaxID=8469 RepID=UPI0018A24350|nr:choline/ethanolaminephosphotransferase 1 isoform X1 [Chelonia mydas]XP_037741026.1 choline/ethanolaminephosphotransferase 1 isoform X1 [Chelonia mydas]XP_037741027.1 choline/ethanolaminephosphotransferase 1 isoform X1 [Chelonia mydas]XP_043389765.1 choline/ethanolaminephosphotransferase 1 isoform X1 [Chelonia mydas]XP_043389766.1 choline/ethanolaminephosphotransferase 1 isoform X1 [Chelonia mydas]XP_043389767.1 choline/ethanolaminephosphotransferase 1 isoform X1 [Chelonia mydas]XP_04338976